MKHICLADVFLKHRASTAVFDPGGGRWILGGEVTLGCCKRLNARAKGDIYKGNTQSEGGLGRGAEG